VNSFIYYILQALLRSLRAPSLSSPSPPLPSPFSHFIPTAKRSVYLNPVADAKCRTPVSAKKWTQTHINGVITSILLKWKYTLLLEPRAEGLLQFHLYNEYLITHLEKAYKSATKPNTFEIIPLQTTKKENNWKTEEALARAAVTLETERIKGSSLWCLWLWWILYVTLSSTNSI